MHRLMSLRPFIYQRFFVVIPAIILTLLIASSGICQEVQTTEMTSPTLEVAPKSHLISKNFPGETWTFFSGKKDAKFPDTWTYVEDRETGVPYVICSGQPYGYIRTKKTYENFEFGLEWRFPKDENGNSGVLVYTTGDDRIWPTSLQVQLQQPFAGSVFPSGGAKSSNELRNIPMLARPINQWNRCVITSLDGTVTVTVNDQKVGSVEDCEPRQGSISLQSEGSEIHFRNIWIRELPKAKKPSRTAHKRARRQYLLSKFKAPFSELSLFVR